MKSKVFWVGCEKSYSKDLEHHNSIKITKNKPRFNDWGYIVNLHFIDTYSYAMKQVFGITLKAGQVKKFKLVEAK